MYKLESFNTDSTTTFTSLLKTKWNELHNNTSTFRYKIDKLQKKIVNGKYLLLLNPDRWSKRRQPEAMNDICQPFDVTKFNFTKVSLEEILFSIEGKDSDVHSVLVNDSPISRYHSLLCPSINKHLPQVVTPDSLELAVQIMFTIQDRDMRIVFNSMCGYASVNHLHYHLLEEQNTLYVEDVQWTHVKGSIYRLDESYPVPAICFEVQKHNLNTLKEVWKVLEYLLKKSIAHNMLITKRSRQGGCDDAVCVVIWPRKSTAGAKPLGAFNVAALELSGWFTIYNSEDFNRLQAEDLENELVKWNIDDFSQLCEEIKNL
ncbi:GDP-D-glucose phosphorylase 1 [Trichoplusia ni]|uniref:GDP-D-glucose phosphorylase 1 n=1 Tax=Trichoplusia ni TaxID=7111 RepID=A0A7E5W818_TRINI|nr:GDP-D-glucose phosphorylase 1 [Trichoplusia ni]